MLDISIKSGKDLIKKDLDELLNSRVKIYQKLDGVKINAIKVQDTGTNDWIISYKGNILYPGEFDYLEPSIIKEESIGCSQYKFVLEHFNSLGKTDIPIGTELFLECLIRKPTLSSNYTNLHKLVLIGYSNSTHSTSFGKIEFNSGPFMMENREKLAESLNLEAPTLLFNGFLGSNDTFIPGIVSKELYDLFLESEINWDNPEKQINDISELLLKVPSKYGGLEEGVVIVYNNKLIKFQQDYQVDQNARRKIKLKYIDSNPEIEKLYWVYVNSIAKRLSVSVKGLDLQESLKKLSSLLKNIGISFKHDKKSKNMIKDDIQLTAKRLIIKQLHGNNNCLLIGKFRVLTHGHAKMIKQALLNYDNVIVCLVTNKESEKTKELREKMILAEFPEVKLIHHSSANISTILNKCFLNINAVLTGTDRLKDYQRMSRGTIDVIEIPRTEFDISASKVLALINSHCFFEENTPKSVHKFYKEIKETYQ